MTDTKSVAEKVARKFCTRDPFEIASSSGFIVMRVPLDGIRGFLQSIIRNNIIYINDALDEHQSNLVCAHELGHWFMHRKMNRIFLDTRTHFITSRYETEANRFAVDFLFSDDDLAELHECTIDQVTAYMGVSRELAEYRMLDFASINALESLTSGRNYDGLSSASCR